MSKKSFHPQEWVTVPGNLQRKSAGQFQQSDVLNDLEIIIRQIEASRTDITSGYMDWRNIGFALVEELGEDGRALYHRISRFYPAYQAGETDRQYDKCLHSNKHGITIRTLFHLAEKAGIDISVTANTRKADEVKNIPVRDNDQAGTDEHLFPELPVFPDEIYAGLPDILKRVVNEVTSPEERDILLLGSLTAISSGLPNIYGIYAKREVYPNLFLFVTAQASAGKGRLSLCRRIVEPIHQELRMQSRKDYETYQRQEAAYVVAKNKADLDRPKEPPLRMLVIPANNSATGVFQILNDNNGMGLIFETEGDTLTQTFKTEHGNYSDGFRKAFHHEIISYNRRKDREYVELATPRLSALLSGTPRQVITLIPNAENGLFSRFIFYCMNLKPVWNDVFMQHNDQTLDHYFTRIGEEFHIFYKQLQSLDKPIRFSLTAEQQRAFHTYFSQTQEQYFYLCGVDFIATVRRLGLITFRMAMILTTLRVMDTGYLANPLVCSDTDFQTALSMVKILLQHAAAINRKLTEEQAVKKHPSLKQLFFDQLPAGFTREDYLATAKRLDIKAKTAETYMGCFTKKGLINHLAYNKYIKTSSVGAPAGEAAVPET